MVPFVAAALPLLVEAAPALIRLFGNGEQSEKNAKAAEKVAELAMKVTGEATVEGAAVQIQADPDAASRFSEAVQANWYEISEAGGGGIDGARKADQKARESCLWWQSPALLVSGALLPLVYLVVIAVLFRAGWSENTQVMVVSSVISLTLGSISGFFLGSSYSSQRKTEITGR